MFKGNNLLIRRYLQTKTIKNTSLSNVLKLTNTIA